MIYILALIILLPIGEQVWDGRLIKVKGRKANDSKDGEKKIGRKASSRHSKKNPGRGESM